MTVADRRVPVNGISLHVREWQGAGIPFVLVHGLASNARTWDAVATRLAAAGHRVVAVDQRGHGESDRPDSTYSFDEVTADLLALLDVLELEQPVIAGQSWGGNVVLDFGARHSERTGSLVLVDGGFIELSVRPGGSWEEASASLKPPAWDGARWDQVESRIRSSSAGWSPEGVEGTLANLERLPDGGVRARLPLDYHMRILRSLWDHHPPQLYPALDLPVAIAVARGQDRMPKHEAVGTAQALLRFHRIRWFDDTAHDIYAHRPADLAGWMLDLLSDGFLRGR